MLILPICRAVEVWVCSHCTTTYGQGSLPAETGYFIFLCPSNSLNLVEILKYLKLILLIPQQNTKLFVNYNTIS